ncbi:MAG: hypothetical protein QXH12_02720 [Candidatus Caldarchaeum sp.]
MRRSLRTRSRKRIAVRTPGGGVKLIFRESNPGKPTCRYCGRTIHGIVSTGRGSFSSKTVSRMFGGVICASCLAQRIINVAAAEWSSS